MKKITTALISVYDKTGIVELAAKLAKKGVEIYATYGTHKALEKNGVKTFDVSALTGSPELINGEIKTLHPAIYASIIANPEDPQEMDQLKSIGGKKIDLLVVNPLPLVPPEQPVKSKYTRYDTTIDIGCSTMVRAAARSFDRIVLLTNPERYDEFIAAFDSGDGTIPEPLKKKLAIEAFEMLADYDVALFEHFNTRDKKNISLPETMFMKYRKKMPLKHGENPHQKAAFYSRPESPGITICDLEMLHGSDLSQNNLNDVNAALEIALEFDRETAIVIKHGNPVGIAVDKEPCKAFQMARDADKVASLGAVVAFTSQVDKKTAKELESVYTEVIIAPKYTDGALDLLKNSKKTVNLRILRINAPKWVKPQGSYDIHSVLGGVVIQTKDDLLVPAESHIKVVSKRKPTRKQLADLVLAWKICKYVRSNAIVIVKDNRTLGIGAGHMSRLDSMKFALDKSGEEAVGAVLASDSYFPFRNAIDEAAKYGISAIIQPGGARRDDEIIMVCDEQNIALCLTGMRHFRY